MTTNGMTIRLFQPSDLPQMADLERAVFGSGAYSYYFFRQIYDLFPQLIWVAASERMLVGHVCGAIDQSGETGWLLDFGVHASARRTGVGQQLIACCLDEMAQAGVERVKTTIHVDNEAGIRLCEKVGFRRTHIEENYYGDGEDRIILEYTL